MVLWLKKKNLKHGMMINDELKYYLRLNPKWYILLSRYPELYKDFYEQYKIENRLTFADKIEKVGMLISMIEMFI